MHSFKDCKDQQWDIELVRSTLRLILSRTGVDLLKLFEPDVENNLSFLADVVSDEEKLIAILAVACERQIIERKITPIQFGDLLKADQLHEAADALCREGASFFPMRQRSAIISVLDTAKIVVERLFDTLPENFNASDAADLILKQLHAENSASTTETTTAAVEPSTNSAGGSPDDSASTLTDSAFLNFADSTPLKIDGAGITPQPSL